MKTITFKVSAIASAALLIMMMACGGSKTTEEKNKSSETKDNPKGNVDIGKQITDSGFVRVGFEPDAPPAYFMDEKGNSKGFDYELIKHIMKNAFGSAKIKSIEKGYDELPDLLKSGGIQIMAGGRTVEDGEGIIYSKPYLTYGYSILTTTDNKRKFNSVKSLSGKTIGVYDDATESWVKENFDNPKVVILGDKEDENTEESDWMGDLVKGDVDAIVYDFPFAANEIGDYRNKIVISAKNINDPSKPNEYVLGIPVGQGELLAKINEAIDEYKSTSDYAKMIQEYIPNPGKDSKEEEEDKKSKKDESEYYTVRSGETLSLIAKAHLGDMSKYREIYELNSDVLASADIVYTGQKLRKPKGWQ